MSGLQNPQGERAATAAGRVAPAPGGLSTERAQTAESPGWVKACPLADVPEDAPVRVEVDGLPICLAKVEGRVYAIQDNCSHADIPLSEGELDGTTVECWLHGSRFDLATGEPTGLPATEPVPVYDTTIEGDTVCVNIAGSAAGGRLES